MAILTPVNFLNNFVSQSLKWYTSNVVVSGQTVNASVVSYSLSYKADPNGNYWDIILQVQLSFSSNGGTLQQINIAAQLFCSAQTCAYLGISSQENVNVPSGSVTISKTYVARWYVGVSEQ